MMRGAAFVAVAFALGPLAPAQQPAPPRVNATLTVRLAAGKAVYAMGELIPLTLEFNGAPNAGYYFSTETYDRSGRMWTEQYLVTPADGVDDPLAEYYRSGVAGGGLRSEHVLDGTPFTLRVNLNDWIRFLRPGRYELVVRSARLHSIARNAVPELRSEPLEIQITAASAEFAAGELAKASPGYIDTLARLR